MDKSRRIILIFTICLFSISLSGQFNYYKAAVLFDITLSKPIGSSIGYTKLPDNSIKDSRLFANYNLLFGFRSGFLFNHSLIYSFGIEMGENFYNNWSNTQSTRYKNAKTTELVIAPIIQFNNIFQLNKWLLFAQIKPTIANYKVTKIEPLYTINYNNGNLNELQIIGNNQYKSFEGTNVGINTSIGILNQKVARNNFYLAIEGMYYFYSSNPIENYRFGYLGFKIGVFKQFLRKKTYYF